MQLPTQTFTQFVRGQVAAIQGAASGLLDFAIGAILRAVVESNSQVSLWLQGLILQLLTVTRLGTSRGADVDSWAADFDLPRLQAVAGTTQETFGRFTTTLQAIVGIGASVETEDGSQQYVVIQDTTNPAYRPALNGYVLAPGVASITVPIQAAVAGAGANASIGAINTIISAIPGVDYCTNAEAVTNGEDAETDAAYKVRFVAWINSLSRAVLAAIRLAVTSTQLNVTCVVVENYDYSGNWKPGFFYVVANDGTGSPSAALINQIGRAVEQVRGLTITYAIFPPVIVPATVTMSIQIATGYDQTATINAVEAAIEVYMGLLNIGQTMSWTRLAQLAFDASPGVIDVQNIRLNGGPVDLQVSMQQVIQLQSVQVVPL